MIMNEENKVPANAETDVEKRREFMKKLGKYAIVAPPVVVTLMTYSKRSAASIPGGGSPISANLSPYPLD